MYPNADNSGAILVLRGQEELKNGCYLDSLRVKRVTVSWTRCLQPGDGTESRINKG
jgi:hypothetical protein